MNGSIKIFSLLLLVIGVVVAAYLYVSRAEDAVKGPPGTENVIDSAQDATNNFNEVQQRARDLQQEQTE